MANQGDKKVLPIGKGARISLEIKGWAAYMQLSKDEVSVLKQGDNEDDDIITPGALRLLPYHPKANFFGEMVCSKHFVSIRDAARNRVKKVAFATELGDFVPYSVLGETVLEIVALQEKYMETKRFLLDHYDDIILEWTNRNHSVVPANYPSKQYLEDRIQFDWSVVEFAAPEGIEAKILGQECLSELLEDVDARDRLARMIKDKATKSFDSIADQCTVQLMERAAKASSKLLGKIVDAEKAGIKGRVDPRSIRSVVESFELLKTLNWMENEHVNSLLDNSIEVISKNGLAMGFTPQEKTDATDSIINSLSAIRKAVSEGSSALVDKAIKTAEDMKVEDKKPSLTVVSNNTVKANPVVPKKQHTDQSVMGMFG